MALPSWRSDLVFLLEDLHEKISELSKEQQSRARANLLIDLNQSLVII